jgi:Chaperone of endosialidase
MPTTFDEVIADIFTIKNDTIPSTAWPKLTCGIANEVTVQDSSLKLGDQREIFFQNAGQLRAAADLRFLTGASATEKLRILANGNVGIGVANPGASLEVTGFIRASDGLESNAANKMQVGTRQAQPLQLLTNNKAALTIDAAGNVGIGTTNPTHRFHVLTSDAVGLFESTGTQAYLRLSTSEGLDNRVEITNRAGGRLSLWTAGGGDVFNITRSGNVGIGTTNPTSRVDIYAQDALNMVGYQPFLTLTDSNAGGARARIQNVNGSLNFQTHYLTQAGGSAMYIQNGTQNVGIDITSPQAKLHVSGPLIAAGSVFPSDARLKTNIEPMSDVLERLHQVRGVSFDWNEKYEVFGTPMGERQIGIIAQELEAVFPEMVMTVGDYDYKAIDYSKLTVLLLEALHELHAKVGQLERRVETERNGHA